MRQRNGIEHNRARLTLEPLEERAVPTIFTVSNLNDGGPGSLRQAISAANAAADPDVIRFSPGLTGTINLTLAGDDNTNAGGDLDILNPVSIEGPGADLLTVRQTVPNERVFDVQPASGANVSISGLTITGGNGTNDGGGGVRMVGAVDLTLSAVEVTGNSSGFLNGGGGVLQLDTNSLLIIRNSTIANNSTGAGLDGGGIRVVNGAASILNSTISGNTTGAEGGGILISGAGSAIIRNSTIVGNRAPNTSLGRGGGILIAMGGSANLSSNIIAGNGAGFLGDDVDGIVEPSSDHNLIGKDTGLMGIMNGVNGNIVGTSAAPINPRLGPLQLNGGHTRTQALLPGSPAIDKGFAPGEITSDQRGPLFARTFGPAPDIGAVEVQPNPGPTGQAIQAAIQAVGILLSGGAHFSAFAFGDVSGDSVNDIVLALRLRNGRLLLASLDGVDGHIQGAFAPFPARVNPSARVQLVTLDFSTDSGSEIGLLVTNGGLGVPRVSIFNEIGRRLL